MYFTSFVEATSFFGVIRKLSKQGRKEGVCSEGPKNSTTFAKIVCVCVWERERKREERVERENVKVEVKYGERKLETDNAEIGWANDVYKKGNVVSDSTMSLDSNKHTRTHAIAAWFRRHAAYAIVEREPYFSPYFFRSHYH